MTRGRKGTERTIRPLTISHKIYLGLVLFLFLAKVAAFFLPVHFLIPSQKAAFDWKYVIGSALLGWLGLKLSEKTGFPEIWGSGVSSMQRLLIPCLLGLGLGVGTILADRIFHISQIYAALLELPSIHIEFPSSLLLYAYGAVVSEIWFRLFPLPLSVWLISTLLLRNRRQAEVFQVVAIVASLVEPLQQTAPMKAYPGAMGMTFAVAYAANLTGAHLFRRFGFLAALLLRLSYYLVWHIIGAGFL